RSSSRYSCKSIRASFRRSDQCLTLDEAEYADCVDHRQGESPPQAGSDKTQPSEMDEAAAKQRNEQPIAARRFETQDAHTRIAAGRGIFPDRHKREQQYDRQKKQRGRERPCHPSSGSQWREPVGSAVLGWQKAG